MFRLGIVGSDNSHAEAFSKLANLDEGINGLRIDDVRVTHIYGTDPKRTEEVAAAGKIPHVVGDKEAMIGHVDGILCVWRHGARHMPDVRPFLEAGIPAFVDKPLACSVGDARILIDAAQKANVGFTSFSTLRYAANVVEYIAELKKTAGVLTAGMSTGPAQLDSEYGGIFFYGIHAVELMNAVWGYGCERVRATLHGGNVVATCLFKDGPMVVLNFLGNAAYVFHLAAFGKDGWKAHTVDSATCYYDGMQVIMRTLRTGQWPLTPEQLLEPVKILAAVNRSLKENREVSIEELD
ncbi:MAG TPA: Gfo/Idh/MocA family oxidoreductase [Candidatus Hydrogenedentes bacterium]|nr:Gfo/Idh/MocA family oxidoreductase [Candidatus Hydrogenedentota bacterium]HOV74574.1 Gfo/Idh/MocA family oxidoreductase [Candidatus Hydrogenedentota bacterium]HPC16974.1 Gfo/Idh/MocA family oxidoreductase [Candidatus Hydrogenedentota bacterium]HRT20887.1 Gfo/Idh/MocA family oxidoreductase [Candidatus Hydrogenedentota bacterium]HRT66235.1 Gfo/Idh/MocA family oxidoreductase [Candidatus Hydrogenedentota bacterium]